MKKRFENWLIKKIKKSGMFEETDIDQSNKTICFGLMGMKEHFLDNREKFWISILVSWYKYKITEKRFTIRSSFLGKITETII